MSVKRITKKELIDMEVHKGYEYLYDLIDELLQLRDELKGVKRTNSNIIRNMTDTELSEYICGIIDIGKDKFINGITIPNYDENSIYEWLKSEVAK